MSPFLPLLDEDNATLVNALARLGMLVIPSSRFNILSHLPASPYIVLADEQLTDSDKLVSFLDSGANAIAISASQAKDIVGRVTPDRLFLILDAESVSAISDKIRTGVSGVLFKAKTIDIKFITSIAKFFSGAAIYVLQSTFPQLSVIRELKDADATLVIPTSCLTLGQTSEARINVADAFVAPLKSDRPDGLFPTVVSSYTHGGRALGLVYSSKESIAESIATGRGVYQSRKHGLWRKGETSGATQEVVKISVDCDCDTLEFSVIQAGDGFCHKGSVSCFGDLNGLAALESTLKSRLESAPEGSYTRRLFNDSDLLRSKIMEEADELCRAESKEDIAFEAADLLYFALTRCIAHGVSLSDIEVSLDQKARKVTRRAGDAKPQFLPPVTNTALPSKDVAQPNDTSGPIKMQTFDLTKPSTSAQQRAALLKRPVLNSTDMIAKVKPIVEDVRKRGDVALLELTAKYDKARLSEPVLRPPYPPELMALDGSVRDAIDTAYANIYKFHEAQYDKEPLVVETMPGVVCSRFARPIARVGLYVPGGTAILPSTALMLGIPAQVAGCKEIVLATPPSHEGKLSPEVVYVAHRIGASAILRAGGAQAVAALAYGTQTVPKVDKIFGPGNQWVTAAKMLVQNDTDALVAIDMPAGPSEVLVIADSSCNPSFVAADLLSQAEHGVDSQVVLVAIAPSPELLQAVESQVDIQAKKLARVSILRESVSKSLIVVVASREEAIAFSNDYAPEHLILHVENAASLLQYVQNAGSVFVGPWSPESCGDYASGTNHTLPTNGYARQFSGVNTLSFQKHITSQELTKAGLDKLGPVVATLADCEGLGAHANAVRIRLGL